MNLYSYYSQPQELAGFGKRHLVPDHIEELYYADQPITAEQLRALKPIRPELARTIAIEYKIQDPELEELFLKDPHFAEGYAHYVVQGPWPRGEPIIAQSARYSLLYAEDTLKGRFPAGEAVMRKDPKVWRQYQNFLRDHG